MANPILDPDVLKRNKPIGEELGTKDTLAPTMPTIKHNATPPTMADGDVREAQSDDMGNLKVAFGDPTQIAAIERGEIIPAHDQRIIDESDPNNIGITYKLATVTVATKTIVTSGTTTTITLTVV